MWKKVSDDITHSFSIKGTNDEGTNDRIADCSSDHWFSDDGSHGVSHYECSNSCTHDLRDASCHVSADILSVALPNFLANNCDIDTDCDT